MSRILIIVVIKKKEVKAMANNECFATAEPPLINIAPTCMRVKGIKCMYHHIKLRENL